MSLGQWKNRKVGAGPVWFNMFSVFTLASQSVVTGTRRGYILDRAPIYDRASLHTRIHPRGQFRAACRPDLHVFELMEETVEPRGNF